jgi:hypothetical protein
MPAGSERSPEGKENGTAGRPLTANPRANREPCSVHAR